VPRTTKKDLRKRYDGRLEAARRFREQEKLDDLWRRLIDLYRGKQWPQEALTEVDRLVVNTAFSTINVIYPSVSVNFPKITVNPNRPEDENRAVITEAVVNYLWRHYDYQEQFRLAVKDFLMVGHGWLKVGYAYKEREVGLSPVEKDKAYAEAVEEADTYAVENPDLAGELPTDDEIYHCLPETKVLAVKDNPFVERVSPFDIYVDPEATSLHDARWIAQRIVRTIEEVKADKDYDARARNAVKPDSAVRFGEDDKRGRRPQREDVDCQRVTIWEFYDLATDTFCVFSKMGEDFLVGPKPIPFASGHPFVMLRNYEVPDQFYPMGDLEAIEPLQHELNMLRTQMQQARRKYARKYLYHESSFDSNGRQALESDRDNVFVPVSDETKNLAEVVAPLPQVGLPADLYNFSTIVENDMGTVSGVSEYQRGQVPETRRTATEAAIISDSVNARAADKLALIEKGIGHVARRVIAVAQQYTTGEQVARVVGKENSVVWVPYTRDDIEGEFDFEVEAGSTQPLNETVRRQTVQSMMNAIAPFLGSGLINEQELLRHVLQFGFGIKNAGKYIAAGVPMVPPMGEEMPPEDETGLDGMGGMNLQPPPMGDNADMGAGPQPIDIPPELLNQLAGQFGLPI
jgi:hypothetical protein